MPSCHTCPHNGKKRAACIRCRGPAETNHHGTRHVSMDSKANAQGSAEIEAALARFQAEQERSPEAPDNAGMDAARRVLAAFVDLPPADRDLVCWRMQNPRVNLLRFAGRHARKAKTKQALYARMQRIAARHPLIGVVLATGAGMADRPYAGA